MSHLERAGGYAALLHAAAYVVGMVLGVTTMFPLIDAGPDRYLEFVTRNRSLVYVWNLISYWGSAITLVIMVLALHQVLRAFSPALMQTASAFGLIWAGLIIASGNLMLHDLGVIAELYRADPAAAASTWTALESIETGIVSGNEMVGALWILALSVAALRTDALSRALNSVGIAIGAAGVLTMIPGLTGRVILVFGPGVAVWSAWMGIVLLRRTGPVQPARVG